MALTRLLAAVLAAGQIASGYLVAPAGTAFPGASSECSAWVYGSPSLTCAEIESEYDITLTQFATWNPDLFEISATCAIISGYYYCVQINFESTVTTTSSSSTSTSTSTTFVTSVATTVTGSTSTVWGDGLSTPSPIQTGMTNICYEYHLVVSEDTCAAIASSAGVSLSDFESWNPAVGTSCTDLDIGDYVCIRVLGYGYSSATPTPSSSRFVVTTTPTSTGDGVSTPSPVQTGMVSTCDSFYLVVSGDSCAVIAADADISLADFYAWNPAVGSSCAYLGLGDYVCVGVIGSTVTATPTSTGDGVSTPSPVQTGMVSTCDSFYLVVSGDSCSAIAADADISLTDFYSWNPAVGSSCAYLGLGDYVCVGVIGSTATTTITATATTTSSGVTTPSPIQTGMVSDCDAFYYVVSGDGCSTIATAEGVSVADLELWNPAIGTDCTNLWLDTYICVGV
ncbi:hypothetical protein N7466_002269 [Penicillium verhagenii]|uniref:uncharacterized protein n=1 Tax=Penicillium verhagenii TaxID=1562060 RepID=UPI002544F67D|nr:uncharacterized protein N7466_002269 [Penicillium verhagenii]KAJ5939135.1 hypothetical protein N7466_002269 [Penicillium verhagenii]